MCFDCDIVAGGDGADAGGGDVVADHGGGGGDDCDDCGHGYGCGYGYGGGDCDDCGGGGVGVDGQVFQACRNLGGSSHYCHCQWCCY